MSIDLNDPTTWPDDPEELLKLGAGEADIEGGDESDADKAEASESKTETTPESGESDEGKEEQPEAAEAEGKGAEGKDDSSAAADPGDSDAGAKEEEEQTELIDGIPVLTRDGKRHIPFDVLKNTRARAQDAEGQVKELQEQIQKLEEENASRAEPAAKTDSEPSVTRGDEKDEAKFGETIQALRENWGDDIADALELVARRDSGDNTLMESVTNELKDVKGRLDEREHADYTAEEAEVNDAIEASPLMLSWMEDRDNSEWYGKALEVHRVLVGSDADYQRMSWEERFQTLPDKVESLYGKSPHRAVVEKVQPSGKKVDKQEIENKAAEAKEKAEGTPPSSLSDIKGGEADATDEFESLEDKSPVEIQAMMDKLAADSPEKLQQFLEQVS